MKYRKENVKKKKQHEFQKREVWGRHLEIMKLKTESKKARNKIIKKYRENNMGKHDKLWGEDRRWNIEREEKEEEEEEKMKNNKQNVISKMEAFEERLWDKNQNPVNWPLLSPYSKWTPPKKANPKQRNKKVLGELGPFGPFQNPNTKSKIQTKPKKGSMLWGGPSAHLTWT